MMQLKSIKLIRADYPVAAQELKARFLKLPYMAQAFLLAVALPTFLSVVYYGLIASNIYISEARFAVRSNEATTSGSMLSAVIGVTTSGGTGQDTAAVKDYILSMDMLNQLQNKLHIRQHYAGSDYDWFSRLGRNDSQEDFLEYFQKKVEVLYDVTSGIVTLKTKAYTADKAREIAAAILELSEQLVNSMSERIAADSVQFAQRELDRAETRVRLSTSAVTNFRNTRNTIDPDKKTGAVLTIVAELEGKLAATRAELSEAKSFMRDDSAQVTSLKSRIKALEEQVQNESRRLTGNGSKQLSGMMEDYEALVLDRSFAQERYTRTLAALEIARTEASRKQRYLVTFVTPSQPDEALEPHRLWNIFTTLIMAFLIYVIGALVWSSIKDHMGH